MAGKGKNCCCWSCCKLYIGRRVHILTQTECTAICLWMVNTLGHFKSKHGCNVIIIFFSFCMNVCWVICVLLQLSICKGIALISNELFHSSMNTIPISYAKKALWVYKVWDLVSGYHAPQSWKLCIGQSAENCVAFSSLYCVKEENNLKGVLEYVYIWGGNQNH